MSIPELLFEYSSWFILACIAIGATYALLLYSEKRSPWSQLTNYALLFTRFVTVTVLGFLLLGPFIKQLFNSTEKPGYAIVIDNSQSIGQAQDSAVLGHLLKTIEEVSLKMEERGFEIVKRTIDGQSLNSINEIEFDAQRTDLANALQDIQATYEGRNLGGMLLISDGIYNQGSSPTFSTYNFEINTIGIGDTIPRKDISIKSVYHNSIAYQGNKFPLMVELSNNGFSDEGLIVYVTKNGAEIGRKSVSITEQNDLERISFEIEAEESGMQHYRVEVLPKEEEVTTINNFKDVFIDVIEGKEKILLIGLSPHPDIKAIASTIDKNENYEVVLHVPGLNDFIEDKYDLVIFHQAFDRFRRNDRLLSRYLESQTPVWLILGNQTNLQAFNQANGLINLTTNRNQKDLVRPAANRGFTSFNIDSEDYQSTLAGFPPITVPFGKTELREGGEVLLYQQVGSITTNKPLLAINERSGSKIAVMMGEGFWQWRTMEYAMNEKQETFDEIILKLIQFLSAKEDKRKFRTYPSKSEFFEGDEIGLETEIYNDIYEPIYGNEISLKLVDEEGSESRFSFTTSKANNRFKLNDLTQGIYRFEASTLIDGQQAESTGEFSVKALQLESLNLTANHSVLRSLSASTGGQFSLAGEIDSMEQILLGKEPQGTIHTSETFLPLINMKWIFFVILFLLTIEWFTRKYNGAY